MNVILNVYHVSFAKAWLYESRGFHFYDVKNVSIKLLVLNLFLPICWKPSISKALCCRSLPGNLLLVVNVLAGSKI